MPGRGVQPVHEDEILAVVTSSASGDGAQSIDVSVVELTCVPGPSDVIGSFFTLIAWVFQPLLFRGCIPTFIPGVSATCVIQIKLK